MNARALRVDGNAQEVVGGRIADVEPDRRVELDQLDQLGRAKRARLAGRQRVLDLGANLLDRSPRLDAKRLAVLAVELPAPEDHARRLDLGRTAAASRA